MLKVLAALVLLYIGLVALLYFRQRSLLYFPSHRSGSGTDLLKPWSFNGRLIGWCHEVTNAQTIWLMLHGNGGQAADRGYVLPCLSGTDSLYVLEYPGYGLREGKPSLDSFNNAASEAYNLLRRQYPHVPVCVLGESLGTGPASFLAREKTPPDKIVLVVPYDTLANVAGSKFPFVPVRLLLHDNWNNVQALQQYTGPVELYGAAGDQIIPFARAKALASRLPKARLVCLDCGHNDWAAAPDVKLRR